MIMAGRPIVKDQFFLARKSRAATAADIPVARDLLDTLSANREGCVGLAANMIGEAVRIIVFDHEGTASVMFNPEIIKAEEPYETEEGCLSLAGVRKTKRFNKIKVRYQNEKMQVRVKSFSGWTAQIIQHEIDHCNGILI
ncbi:MAG: peptide deformylase [Oscillospiraceae bacterium]|nr:peptide deformylase [Oscillospiraceae bacterium]